MAKKILILCTGNSCRSILAEAIINKYGNGRIAAYSAGSKPAGQVNPHALALLKAKGFDVCVLRSKNWDEFSGPNAPALDMVITVCGNAAGETCPVFLGAPVRGHWGVEDPADATGTDAEVREVFEETYRLLQMRVEALLAFDFENSSDIAIIAQLAKIGRMEGAA